MTAVLASVSAVAGTGEAGPGATMTVALTGDSIITRPLAGHEEPGYVALLGLLRGADAAFTNLEISFHDYEVPPAAQSGGIHLAARPAMARELAWAGFDFVSRANNHALDWGAEGMALTTRYVEEAGLVHAGTGADLARAREARFLDTPAGRVALIAVTSTYPELMRAGPASRDMPGRPGTSVLRHKSVRLVESGKFDQLVSLAESLGLFTNQDGKRLAGRTGIGSFEPNVYIDQDNIRLWGQALQRADADAVISMADRRDLEGLARLVVGARAEADLVVVSVHAHETDGLRAETPGFLQEFAHAMVEAGADMVVGHGPHVLRGIEVYRGKPVFYSLGNFIFQNETTPRLPVEDLMMLGLGPEATVEQFNDLRGATKLYGFLDKDAYWESVVAVPEFRQGRLLRIALHPIVLGAGEPRLERGRPVLASPAAGRAIIDGLAELSRPFGTEIRWRDGTAEVVLP